jgi:hypothetical protein
VDHSKDPPDHSMEGFARIALSLDLAIAQAESTPPVATVHPLFIAPQPVAPGRTTAEVAGAAATAPVSNRRALLTDYMRAVAARRQSAGGS